MLRLRKLWLVSSLVCLLSVPHLSQSASLAPVSYDTPNGYGQVSGGTFNYWDRGYTGAGATTTDGAVLTGGLGDLTDGVTTKQNWDVAENSAGTGPYVGWLEIDPTITFHFASAVTFDTVRIHVDDDNGVGYSGVNVPESVDIGIGGPGMNFTVIDPPSADPLWLVFDVASLGLRGTTLSVTLHRYDLWTFADEFEFLGAPVSAVPEPATLSLMGFGLLGLLGYAWRRRWQAR